MGDVPQAADTTTFSNMLSPQNLETLRKHFSDDAIVPLSMSALVTPFPATQTPYEESYVRSILGVLYGSKKDSQKPALTPRDRELTVTAILAVHDHGKGPLLGIHLYWSLMVGLSPDELAAQLFTIGIYNGVDTLSASFSTLRVLLTALDKWTTANLTQTEKLEPAAIVTQITAGFPGNTP